jgi:hypothetical protein
MHATSLAATAQVGQKSLLICQHEEGSTPVTMTAAAAERALQRRA